ncbi:hypothetical protein SUGI_1067750, partial [Cryptomeria japonica]
ERELGFVNKIFTPDQFILGPYPDLVCFQNIFSYLLDSENCQIPMVGLALISISLPWIC